MENINKLQIAEGCKSQLQWIALSADFIATSQVVCWISYETVGVPEKLQRATAAPVTPAKASAAAVNPSLQRLQSESFP